MIIDGHAHVYAERYAQKIVSSFTNLHHMEPTSSLGTGTVDDLLNKMNSSGTDYTVLANFAPIKSVERTNEWTLSLAKKHPQFIPLVSVYPGLSIDKLEDWFHHGAMGIKMHNGIQGFEPTDPGLLSIYQHCNERKIPITFHCGETSRVHLNEYTDISHFLPVLKQYEDIPFVMTHLAAGDPTTILQIAKDFPSAIFDTSITMTGEKCIHRIHDDYWESDENTIRAFRKIGCHRITFGSDYPFGNPISDIARIQRMNLTAAERSMILGENSYRIYFHGSEARKESPIPQFNQR